ncbi:MAG: hypothetical protein ACI9VS_003723 [Candidatus Binatia bacterium]|jgi:hypothetical protein
MGLDVYVYRFRGMNVEAVADFYFACEGIWKEEGAGIPEPEERTNNNSRNASLQDRWRDRCLAPSAEREFPKEMVNDVFWASEEI